MCEWLAVAELFLLNSESNENFYCLCSRVLTRSKILNDESEISEEDLSETEFNYNEKSENCVILNDGQKEDNNLNVSERVSKDLVWENYWSENGEKLVWDSWFKKYKDYINVEYIENKDNFEKSHILDVSKVSPALSSTSEFNGELFEQEDIASNDAWSLLWEQHIQDEYLVQYEQFKINSEEFGDQEEVDALKNCSLNDNFYEFESSEETCENHIEKETFKEDSSSSKEIDLYSKSDDEFIQMINFDLPTSFGRKQVNSVSKKQKINFQKSSDNIKAAFDLLCIQCEKTGEKNIFSGSVNYKLKNIKKQNQKLKMYQTESGRGKPKHVRFDDDGHTISYEEVVVPFSEETKTEEFNKVPFSEEIKTEEFKVPFSEETKTEEFKVPFSEETKTEKINFDNDHVIAAEKLNTLNEETEENSSLLIKLDLKKKKRKKKSKNRKKLPVEIRTIPILQKYWRRRFSLFSKFDLGIKLDKESWFSVTPEKISENTAKRCQCDLIVDAFCGAGGNAIQFALTCSRVIAIDIDPLKIELARNNAKVYGVENRIEFIVGDFFELADKIKADVVFLSPPWGGPSYLKQPQYDLEKFLLPQPISKLMHIARGITDNVALFLPKNSNTYPLLVLAGEGRNVEIEQNFLNNRLIAISVYYGCLIKNISD